MKSVNNKLTEEKVGRAEALVDQGEALILTCPENIRYLCGFDYTDGYAIVMHDRTVLFADSRYIEAARAKIAQPIETVLLDRGLGTAEPILRDGKVKRLFYEDIYMTCAELERWKKQYPAFTFEPIRGSFDALREVKTPDEVALIESAQRIAERAFDHILEFISPERTETEVALELDFFMRRSGADGIAFQTIAVSGSASSLPHGVPRNIPLEHGFLTMDYGAEVGGYRSDMTRTVCIGRADEEMRTIYGTVLRAQLAAESALRAGMLCSEADGIARKIIDDAGYGKCFGHSLGHGVGLFIHEAPNLSPHAGERRLRPGNIVTVEPGIYIEGHCGVRIEDMALIEEDGARILTSCPKELIELCV